MKLSKGKISKAIHKNKQTLKKYKRYGRKNHKSKTFRKRHAINLDRTTLKNYKSLIGGAPEEEKHDDKSITEHNKEVVSDVDIEKTTGLVNPADAVSDVDITKTNGLVNPADAVSDVDITKTNGVVPPADAVSDVDITKTNGMVPPADAVSDVDITKTNEVVPPADAVSDVDITKTNGMVPPADAVSDVDITKTNEVVPLADAVSDKNIEKTDGLVDSVEGVSKTINSGAAVAKIDPHTIITPETTINGVTSGYDAFQNPSAPKLAPTPQYTEINTNFVEAVPVAPVQQIPTPTSVVVESIDKLADYIAEKIKQKLQEQSDNDPFTRVTTANTNISQ